MIKEKKEPKVIVNGETKPVQGNVVYGDVVQEISPEERERRDKALDELARETEKLGLYDHEFDCGSKPEFGFHGMERFTPGSQEALCRERGSYSVEGARITVDGNLIGKVFSAHVNHPSLTEVEVQQDKHYPGLFHVDAKFKIESKNIQVFDDEMKELFSAMNLIAKEPEPKKDLIHAVMELNDDAKT